MFMQYLIDQSLDVRANPMVGHHLSEIGNFELFQADVPEICLFIDIETCYLLLSPGIVSMTLDQYRKAFD